MANKGFTLTITVLPTGQDVLELGDDDGDDQMIAGRGFRRRSRLDDEEKGFMRVMRDGFRRDDCDIEPGKAMAICAAFRRDEKFREEVMVEAKEIWSTAPAEAKTALAGCYGAATFAPTFSATMKVVADDGEPRDWSAFADFWVKALEAIGKLAEILLPLIRSLFG